ncbi:MAG: MlaD family protein [Syntrophobacteraceae bacterium]|jgi:phospholipid/cholesterol/gamma-HCH transport system substrate-binding protein
MQVFRSEIKVGLLVVISFILFVIGIFVVSDVRSLWDKKKTLVILFHYADGITAGSPVWYAGFEVGGVKDIRIASGVADRIAITVRISPDARVRKDSSAEIRSLGMMGAKYVEISPGSPDSPELASGDVIEGKSPASLSEIIETGGKVASGLVDLVQEAKDLVSEVRNEYTIKETIQNANALLIQLREHTADLGPIMKNIRQVTGQGGNEFVSLIREVRDTNKDVQKRLGSIETELTRTLGQAGQGFSEATEAAKGLRSILDANEDNIASMVSHLNETSRHLEALSEDIRLHPWKVVWKTDGAVDASNAAQWREKGRIGPYGKQ